MLVDANQHVDREGAARAGVGFYGKNTLLITRRFGSWVVLGTLVTDVELDPTPPLELDCGSCTLCIEACPTDALAEPGVLDSTKCLSYWTQAPAPIPDEFRADLGDQVYGCDICQDVCPWNRGVEKRRADVQLSREAEPVVSLVDWLEAEPDELRDRYDRLYVPRNDPRYLRRNALVALGNSGREDLAPLAEPFLAGDDELPPRAGELGRCPSLRALAFGVTMPVGSVDGERVRSGRAVAARAAGPVLAPAERGYDGARRTFNALTASPARRDVGANASPSP